MDNLYENIIKSLTLKKEVENIKRRENEQLEPLLELITQLRQIIHIENEIIIINNNKTIKQLIMIHRIKRNLIAKIKEYIENLCKKKKLYIDEIINKGIINEYNLNIALNLINKDKKTTSKIKKIQEYNELKENIERLEKIIEKTKNLNEYIINEIKKIITIIESNKKPSILKIIKYIKYKKQEKNNNKIIKEIQKQIYDEIKKFFLEDGYYKLKTHCIEELTNTSFYYDRIKNIDPKELTIEICKKTQETINKNTKEIIMFIKNELKKAKKKVSEIKDSSNLDKQINETLHNRHNYITYIESNETNTKEEQPIFSRIIYILKLINMIEKGQINELEKNNKICLKNIQSKKISK